MSEVLKTLRILSSASISRRQMLHSQSQNLTLGIKCINCNGVRITQQHSGCRSRTEILKDLDKLVSLEDCSANNFKILLNFL